MSYGDIVDVCPVVFVVHGNVGSYGADGDGVIVEGRQVKIDNTNHAPARGLPPWRDAIIHRERAKEPNGCYPRRIGQVIISIGEGAVCRRVGQKVHFRRYTVPCRGSSSRWHGLDVFV